MPNVRKGGSYIRFVYQAYYEGAIEKLKRTEKVIESVHEYEKQIALFNPDFIEWLKGMAAGAEFEFA